MFDSPARRGLRESLHTAVHIDTAPNEREKQELHARVCAAVEELRALGWPIERIIVRLKEVADEVGFRQRRDLGAAGREPLMETMVRWCIEQYHGPTEPK